MNGITFGPKAIDSDSQWYYPILIGSFHVGRYYPTEKGATVSVNRSALVADIENAVTRKFRPSGDIDIEFV